MAAENSLYALQCCPCLINDNYFSLREIWERTKMNILHQNEYTHHPHQHQLVAQIVRKHIFYGHISFNHSSGQYTYIKIQKLSFNHAHIICPYFIYLLLDRKKIVNSIIAYFCVYWFYSVCKNSGVGFIWVVLDDVCRKNTKFFMWD